ncbi:MAG TPA: Hsp20/alpha crystallin family protein [Verrucomicrobiae bacterium]|nr:Hsp20/alpha crystallin family protein [Verrucomicrobiae bacterium]
MNANNNRSRSAIIGLVALAIGVAIGVAGTTFRTRILTASRTADADTHQMSSALFGGPNLTSPDQWNPFQEIQNMQAQMDQTFNEMVEQLRMNPHCNLVQGNPGYSLSLHVQDLKDHYEVRAFLPDAKTSDVHVNLENGQTLKVQVNNKQGKSPAQNNGTSQVEEWGQYEQVVQLPTPVKADQMNVKNQGHELIITIPKAA